MYKKGLSRHVIFRFGEFEADQELGELRKEGSKVPLQEKPFQLLVMLLDQMGRVVTREEIRQKLWPDNIHVQFDHSLNVAAAKLRRALFDSRQKQLFIQTVGRRGYRFIAPVARATDIKTPARKVGKGEIRLAVLPFRQLGGAFSQKHFSEGMNEEIIAQLGHAYRSLLGVVAGRSVQKYKGTSKSARKVGRELRADYLLEGSVHYGGDQARVTVYLVKATDELVLWSETYDCELRDMLSFQRQVGEQIVAAVGRELLSAPKIVPLQRSPLRERAYFYYLRGCYHQTLRTEDGLRRSLELFQKAVGEDLNYALAYCGLANSHSLLARFGYGPPRSDFEPARAAALRALETGNNLAESHTALAVVKSFYDWDWKGTEALLRRAIELNASYATAHLVYSYFLSAMRRHEEAILEGRRAQDLDPVSPPASVGLIVAYYFARRYDDAVQEALNSLDVEPNFARTLMWLGISYSQQSRFDEAVSALERARETGERRATVIAWLGEIYARFGRFAQAQELLGMLCSLSGESYVSPFDHALIHVGLGQLPEALKCLNSAYQERFSSLPLFLNADPRLDRLRSHPEYQDLIDRIRNGEREKD